MFCSKCGSEIKEGIRFCPKCGNPQKYDSQSSVERAERTETSERAETSERTGISDQAVPEQKNAVEHNPTVKLQPADDSNTEPIISTWSFLGYRILELIPIVGFIVMIVFALDKTQRNRANYAKAYFLIFVIQILLLVFFYSSIIGFIINMAY